MAYGGAVAGRKLPSAEFEFVRRRRRGSSSTSLEAPYYRETARKTTKDENEDAKLSQKETETVVNDFLATFSSLYDDVPPEERTKVLDAIPLVEEDEFENSDDLYSESYTGSSDSLVDD